MAAHGVARDGGLARELCGKGGGEYGGQLLGHVRVHLVVLLPLGLRRIHVEARAAPEVVCVIRALDGDAARRGVRHHEREPARRRRTEASALLREVLIRAGQAREPVEAVHGGRLGLRGQVDRERHLTLADGALVGHALQDPAEDPGRRLHGRRHGWSSSRSSGVSLAKFAARG